MTSPHFNTQTTDSNSQSTVTFETSEDQLFTSFQEMGLREELLNGINTCGFQKLYPVQRRSIEAIVKGSDVVIKAKYSTGRSTSIAVGILQCLHYSLCETQVLWLAATTECAEMTKKNIELLGRLLNVKCNILYDTKKQTFKSNTQHILVSASQNTVFDMIKIGTLKTNFIRTLVIDDADEILNGGYKDQIYAIRTCLPIVTQMVLSVTSCHGINEINTKLMNKPIEITIKSNNLILQNLIQFYIDVEYDDYKFHMLCDLYDTIDVKKSIVCCNTKQRACVLATKMQEASFNTTLLHEDMPQAEREVVIKNFHPEQSQYLITTVDMLSSTMDVRDVSLFVNYEMPEVNELYVERFGGFANQKCVVINLIKSSDMNVLKNIEHYYSICIEEMPMNIADLV